MVEVAAGDNQLASVQECRATLLRWFAVIAVGEPAEHRPRRAAHRDDAALIVRRELPPVTKRGAHTASIKACRANTETRSQVEIVGDEQPRLILRKRLSFQIQDRDEAGHLLAPKN